MAVIRLFFLLVVLGGLTLLLVQNFSPAISLTFLGMKSQPLPLAIWILFSTAAGAFTSLFITTLFQLSNYFAAGRQTRLNSAATERSNNSARKVESRRPEPPPSSGGSGKTESREVYDDWDTDNSNDDWDFDERQNTKRQERGESDGVSSTSSQKTQGVPQESNRNSDGSYSYSYNQPKNSGVGKTESIYDADYRVIVPPYQPSTAKPAEDDDWGFLDDDDEDKDKRSSR